MVGPHSVHTLVMAVVVVAKLWGVPCWPHIQLMFWEVVVISKVALPFVRISETAGVAWRTSLEIAQFVGTLFESQGLRDGLTVGLETLGVLAPEARASVKGPQ